MFLFSVVLPGMNSEGKRTEFNPLSEHDGLIERYKSKNLDGVLEVSTEYSESLIYQQLPTGLTE